jgi:hypothetical protein
MEYVDMAVSPRQPSNVQPFEAEPRSCSVEFGTTNSSILNSRKRKVNVVVMNDAFKAHRRRQ